MHAGAFVLALIVVFVLVGKERSLRGWAMGKGLVAPIVVIGVVLAWAAGFAI